MIQKLSWDSNLFGFSVGKLEWFEGEEKTLKSLLAKDNQYAVVYVFADHEILLELPPVTATDIKVTFCKELQQVQEIAASILEYDPQKHKYQELLDLVYLSGTFSRFKQDVRFTEEDFSKLYQEWIDKSIKSETTKVLVQEQDGNLGGFITLEEVSTESCRIGLTAVHPDYQGKSIATQLIQKCQNMAFVEGKSRIEVSTQDKNVAAKNLYAKNGFKKQKLKYIYHLWNQ